MCSDSTYLELEAVFESLDAVVVGAGSNGNDKLVVFHLSIASSHMMKDSQGT